MPPFPLLPPIFILPSSQVDMDGIANSDTSYGQPFWEIPKLTKYGNNIVTRL